MTEKTIDLTHLLVEELSTEFLTEMVLSSDSKLWESEYWHFNVDSGFSLTIEQE